MDQHEKSPPGDPLNIDSVTIALRARHLQSQAVGNAFRDAIKAAARLATRIASLALQRTGIRSFHGHGGIEIGRDSQWISPRTPLVLPSSARHMIRCDSGTVWVTQGDSNDHVLRRGESLSLRPSGKVVITAMSNPACIRQFHEAVSRTEIQQKEHAMNDLTARERELVALGAAMGSNCAPCIEFHIPAARKAGLSDDEIVEAVNIADKVRQVPALKVLRTALGMLPHAAKRPDGIKTAQECTGASTIRSTGVACCA